MSKNLGVPVFSAKQQPAGAPALDSNAPVPKWKLEEQAKQEREKKARDEFAAQKKKERELEEEEGRKRAEEADRLLATGQVKSTGKNQLRTRKGQDAEADMIEKELNSLDALDDMFNAVLK